jgi:hypothetical protein
MGLDMYIEAEKNVGGWDHDSDEKKGVYKEILEAVGMATSPCPDHPSMSVSMVAAYWRKANHIHNWFVENVQDGVDECQRSYVFRDQIQELVSLCEQVIKIEVGKVGKEAAALLPTKSGFFFGSTDYDEYFIADVEETIRQLKPLLTPAFDGCAFYYRSSW